ncbi:MAG: glutamine--fructose-6-phosphate transaminase (isomerizing) [Candidatus Methanomethylicaceae archaeon]|nr:glutamine--fructose-6-phosphate transaminase (isomerizing) [Candidatus Verstraetearchaeota archaeon]
MCGIFGCICENALKILLDGLKRLEYRGYDSVGIALIDNENLIIRKDKGKIEDFIKNLDLKSNGSIGIGHTRWATHGAPSKENAHPHLDCFGKIAIVHNGVLENFLKLREELIEKGHKFNSNTDSEIIAHFIEEFMKNGYSLKEAFKKTFEIIKGSIACAVITTLEPNKILCYRRESPLIIGISSNGVFCASDMPALIPYTRNVAIVPEDTIVIIEKNRIFSESLDGKERKLEFFEVNIDIEAAEKGGFSHFMIKEIFEQPIAISNTIKIPIIYLDRASKLLKDKIYLTGSGTSYHACLSTSYNFSKFLSINTFPIISSELQEMISNFEESTLIAVSQSGETADTLNAIRYAKSKGAKIIGITNTLGSSITTLSDVYICTQSGPEIGVAATKTFVTQLIALDMLFLRFGFLNGKLSTSDYYKIMDEMKNIPKNVEKILKNHEKIKEISLKYSTKQNAFFLARGSNVAIALEGALKLKEISYIHAEAYPAGESKHGPIALVEPGFLCVFIAPKDRTRDRIIGNIMEMKARGAEIFSIITEGDEELKEISDDYFEIPQSNEIFYSILCTIPLQLFAYYVAIFRGLDPDKPRNLAKSVTVI